MSFADLVFLGGHAFTAGWAGSLRLDVAVAEGRILAVTAPHGVDELIGPRTEVVDASARLLIPGFIDAHAHPIQAGVELLQCEVSTATDAASCLAIVGEYARAHPDEPWILGGGWSMEWFEGGLPTAAMLDAVVGDRPVSLANRDHHGVWASSAALRLAGITRETADPADGRLERDAAGEPTGMLHEGAEALLAPVRPVASEELMYRGLLRAQAELHALGVTGWQDAMLGGYIEPKNGLDAYLRALADGTLTARVTGALWWDRDAPLTRVAELAAIRDRVAASADPELFAADSVKLMLDGIAENYTAALSQPYRDAHGHATGNAGISFVDPQRLRQIVPALEAAGLDAHFHALGDRAVTEALDAVAAARAELGASDARHHLAHLQMVRAEDVPRFSELGAAANLQALWASHEVQLDELCEPFIAPELMARTYPFGDLDRAGARFAAGSDWPVSSPNPLEAIQVAVTRVSDSAPEGAEPLGGEAQKLSLATAVAAYTSGSAWVNRRDGYTGRLVVGFRADLALLDRDVFAHPVDEIADAAVLGTWVGGVRVHAAGAAGPDADGDSDSDSDANGAGASAPHGVIRLGDHEHPNLIAVADALDILQTRLGPDSAISGSPRTGAVGLVDFNGVEVGVWEHTPGISTDVETDELFIVLSGCGSIHFDGDPASVRLGPGTIVRLYEGQRTVWTVTETIRKVYLV